MKSSFESQMHFLKNIKPESFTSIFESWGDHVNFLKIRLIMSCYRNLILFTALKTVFQQKTISVELFSSIREFSQSGAHKCQVMLGNFLVDENSIL